MVEVKRNSPTKKENLDLIIKRLPEGTYKESFSTVDLYYSFWDMF